jgi:hypothetical protein
MDHRNSINESLLRLRLPSDTLVAQVQLCQSDAAAAPPDSGGMAGAINLRVADENLRAIEPAIAIS